MKFMGLLQRARRRFRRWRVLRQLLGPWVLNAVATERPEAFFIEIGANDGQMMDPLRTTILRSRWNGLVVEPVPELYARLVANYQPVLGRVRPVNAAVSRVDGDMLFYHLRNLRGCQPLPAWALGLGSFRRDVLEKHADRIPDLHGHIHAIDVPCLSWDTLCSRYQVRSVDVLLTDTEGYDGEIIAQLDFERWRPALLIYEHHHFESAELSALDQRLRAAGYLMFREGLDTWCLDTRPGTGLSLHLLGQMPRRIQQGRYALAV
jgi:FkbM family methyltransferase